jgi:DNA-binding transcriptional ArsR family regulator
MLTEPEGVLMEDRIEQQITINAPLDRVWQLVSEPGWWVRVTVVEGARRPQGAARVRMNDVDHVLAALADPTRRRLLEALGRRPSCSATTLASAVPVSRQAVVKHLGVLRDSHLVTSRRAGKEVLFSVRPEQLLVTASWMTDLAATWQQRLHRLTQAAES